MVTAYEVCILVRKSGRMIRPNRVLDSFDPLRKMRRLQANTASD